VCVRERQRKRKRKKQRGRDRTRADIFQATPDVERDSGRKRELILIREIVEQSATNVFSHFHSDHHFFF